MSQPPALPPRTWLSRHWKWIVPALALAAAAFLYGFVCLVTGVMKTSDAYQLALARAQESPAVMAALGTPITEGFLMKGNIHVSGPSGQAQLEIPIRGPKGGATIYVAAEKTKGVWHFEYLIVQTNGDEKRFDLSDPPAPRRRPKPHVLPPMSSS